MFFIGDFNSVIPYIVYLSLIWTFVILSFGGKIAAFLHKQPDKEITTTHVIYKSGDQHFLHCYHYASEKKSNNKTTVRVPDLSQLSFSLKQSQHIRIRYVSPPLPSAELFSFLFRGPPLFS
jgi:hypothetical protein